MSPTSLHLMHRQTLPCLRISAKDFFPHVRRVDAAQDIVRRDISHDPIQPDPGVDLGLGIDQQLLQLRFRIRNIFTFVVPLLDNGPGRDFTRINFPLVRPATLGSYNMLSNMAISFSTVAPGRFGIKWTSTL